MWNKGLDRSASYLIELDVIANGGQWSVSRVVVSDTMYVSLFCSLSCLMVLVPVLLQNIDVEEYSPRCTFHELLKQEYKN